MNASESKLFLKAAAIICLSMQSQIGYASMENNVKPSPWGKTDQIGMLNQMTKDSQFGVLNQIGVGKIYDLGVELFVGMPDCCSDAFGDPAYQIMLTHSPSRDQGESLITHTSEAIVMNSHAGTHIDALSHFGLHGEIWNNVKADDALTVRGWTISGAENYPPIIARAVMIDIPRAKKLERLPPSYSITVQDLKNALKLQKAKVMPGDIVLIRTGQMTTWPNKSQRNLFMEPGLSLEAAQWLAEDKKALLLGADNFGLESFPSKSPDNFAPVHSYLLAERGVSFMELLWLEELSKDQLYEFIFIGAPIKLKGASGAPIRPIAIPIAKRP